MPNYQCIYCPGITDWPKAYKPGPTRLCKYCNGEKVHFHFGEGGFKTYEADGSQHHCPSFKKAGVPLEYQEPTAGVNEAEIINLIDAKTELLRMDFKQLGQEVAQNTIEVNESIGSFDRRISNIEASRTLVVRIADKPDVEVGRVHYQFDTVLRALAATMHDTANTVALTGPAGSGKTTIGKQAAKAFNLPFFKVAMSPMATESRVIGFHDAKGDWVKTETFLAYAEANGAFLLIDEFDNGNAALNVVWNTVFDNDSFSFGGVTFQKNERFIPMVTMNTFGYGPDSTYVGRNKQDGATLNRLRPCIEIHYDWQMVFDTMGADAHARKACDFVAAIDRENKDELVFGPRNARGVANKLRAGFTWNEATEMCVWPGVPIATKEKLLANAEY